MAFEFHLPDLAEGMAEAEIVSWKVKVGDKVRLDQPLVEVMSDKATVEIPSPRAGTIAKLNYAVGQMCPVGKVLFVIDEDPAQSPTARSERPGGGGPVGPGGAVSVSAPVAPAPAHAGNGKTKAAPAAPRAAAMEVVDASAGRSRVLATPATRKLARTLDVALAEVPATGRRGRVTSDDVKRYADGGSALAPTSSSARALVPTRVIDPSPLEERIPFRGMRKRIAENMTRSKFTATHFTYVEEIDCTELVAVRDRVKERAAARGVKLTFLPFIMKAVVSGLRKWPQLNASLDEAAQEIVRKKYYHLGIAAQGPQGLMVTVVRDADRRSIFDLAMEIERLGNAVQSGTSAREDLSGSTFTITSLGKLGGVMATPIINFPEVGILGVHKMEQRPAVRDGQIVARWLMNLSISLDHRLVDGWDGAMFLQDVKSLLEDPTTMFMEMI